MKQRGCGMTRNIKKMDKRNLVDSILCVVSFVFFDFLLFYLILLVSVLCGINVTVSVFVLTI